VRRLQWGDIAVEDDPVSGKQVLLWKAERGSKTRQGDGHCRAFCPKAHATNTERCPVRLYLKFASYRPDEMKKPDAPFFLAVNHSRAPDNPVWYSRAALGKNKIEEFLTKAAKNAGLPGNVTNHSVRKTCISRLMDAEVPVNYVAQLSGHKNLKSLDSVTRQLQTNTSTRCLFEQRQEEISHLLKRYTGQTSSQSLGARAIQTARKKASFFGRRPRLLWPFHWFQHQKHRGMHV